MKRKTIAIIIPAILAFSAAGSILAGSAASAAIVAAPPASVHVMTSAPGVWYHT